MKLGLIVPTKDRPDDLRRLFESVVKQQRPVDTFIVVDGSDNDIKWVVDDFPQLTFVYLRVRPPSLPKQRNAGIAAIPEDIDWVGFVDDDLVLMPDALLEMEKFILSKQGGGLKGVGFKIDDQPIAQSNWFNKLFFLGDDVGGKVTEAGFPTAIPPVSEDIETDWLYGGATFWEKSVFAEFSYDEWFKGTGYMEDVDFSFGVSRKYKLMVCSTSRCLHLSHPIPLAKQKSIGEWQITSWWYFFKKYQCFSYPKMAWAVFGMVTKNFLSSLSRKNKEGLLRSFGNLKGVSKIFSGTALDAKGFSK